MGNMMGFDNRASAYARTLVLPINEGKSTNHLDATEMSNGYNPLSASRSAAVGYVRILTPAVINGASIGYVRYKNQTVLKNQGESARKPDAKGLR